MARQKNRDESKTGSRAPLSVASKEPALPHCEDLRIRHFESIRTSFEEIVRIVDDDCSGWQSVANLVLIRQKASGGAILFDDSWRFRDVTLAARVHGQGVGLYKEMAISCRTAEVIRYPDLMTEIDRLGAELARACWCLDADDSSVVHANACRFSGALLWIEMAESHFQAAAKVYTDRQVLLQPLWDLDAIKQANVAWQELRRPHRAEQFLELCQEQCATASKFAELARSALDAVCDSDENARFLRKASKNLWQMKERYERMLCLLDLLACAPYYEPPLIDLLREQIGRAGEPLACAVAIVEQVQVECCDEWMVLEREYRAIHDGALKLETGLTEWLRCNPIGAPAAFLRGTRTIVSYSQRALASFASWRSGCTTVASFEWSNRIVARVHRELLELECLAENMTDFRMELFHRSFWAVARIRMTGRQWPERKKRRLTWKRALVQMARSGIGVAPEIAATTVATWRGARSGRQTCADETELSYELPTQEVVQLVERLDQVVEVTDAGRATRAVAQALKVEAVKQQAYLERRTALRPYQVAAATARLSSLRTRAMFAVELGKQVETGASRDRLAELGVELREEVERAPGRVYTVSP